MGIILLQSVDFGGYFGEERVEGSAVGMEWTVMQHLLQRRDALHGLLGLWGNHPVAELFPDVIGG